MRFCGVFLGDFSGFAGFSWEFFLVFLGFCTVFLGYCVIFLGFCGIFLGFCGVSSGNLFYRVLVIELLLIDLPWRQNLGF